MSSCVKHRRDPPLCHLASEEWLGGRVVFGSNLLRDSGSANSSIGPPPSSLDLQLHPARVFLVKCVLSWKPITSFQTTCQHTRHTLQLSIYRKTRCKILLLYFCKLNMLQISAFHYYPNGWAAHNILFVSGKVCKHIKAVERLGWKSTFYEVFVSRHLLCFKIWLRFIAAYLHGKLGGQISSYPVLGCSLIKWNWLLFGKQEKRFSMCTQEKICHVFSPEISYFLVSPTDRSSSILGWNSALPLPYGIDSKKYLKQNNLLHIDKVSSFYMLNGLKSYSIFLIILSTRSALH